MNTAYLRNTAISTLLAALLLSACGGDDSATLLKSAKEYLAKKDTKAAVIQIKNVLQKEPNLAEARFLLGKALLEGGDATAAEVELRKAMDLKHAPDQTIPLLAKTLLAKGKTKELLEEFGKTELATADGNAELATLVGSAHAASGNIEAAKAALATALAAKPGHVPALLLQAWMKAAERDVEGALTVVDSVLAKAPADAEALKLRGDLLRSQDRLDDALASYRKAMEARPEFLQAHIAAVGLLMGQGNLEQADKQFEMMKKIAPGNPQTHFLGAQLAFQRKDFKVARERLQQFHKLVSPNALSQQLAGAIEYQLGAYGVAEDQLTKALQAEPGLPLARRLLITTYLRSGQPTKALEILKPVLDKIDNSPAMLALAGEVYIQQGDYRKAEDFYTRATKLDPKDSAKRTRLAMTHMAKGNVEGAVDELEDISASDSGTVADLALISAHLRRNEIDKALKAIEVLEKKRPDDPAVFNIRGQTLLAKKDVAGARKGFEKALELNPAYFPAAASLATLDLNDKKPEDAKRRFEAVLKADPKNVQALLALAELGARAGAKVDDVATMVNKAVVANPADIAARMALIQTYLRGNEAKKAAVAAQDAITAIPDRPELVGAAGQAQMAAGDYNQALATYSKLSTMMPKSPLPYLRMAEVNVAAKNKDEAIKNLQKGLEVMPDYLDAQRALIMLHVEAGRFKEAQAIARDVQKQQPGQSVGYALEGDIAVARKAWPEAIKAFHLGLERAPSTDLVAKLYTGLIAEGNRAEAERQAAAWLKANPKDLNFRNFLAEAASSRQDWLGASQNYKAILELQPNSPIVLNNLAWAAGRLKDPKALEYAEKANKLAPDQPAIMDTLAMLLVEQGSVERGRELLVKAVELAPDQPALRLNLARVLLRVGDKAGARTQLDTLSKLGDKFPGQAEVAKLKSEL